MTCCGLYLKDIGIRDIFVNNEIYGPVVADNAVMAGKNYALSRGAMRNLSEAVDRIRLDEFKETNPAIFESVEHIIPDILTSVKAAEDLN